ncbi:MAG: DUF885 family protein [Planctomycetota bacterium]
MKLADDYWKGTLDANPRWSTSLGDRSRDALLEDPSPAAKEREVSRLEGLLAEVKKLDRASLSAEDALTASALELQIRNDLDLLAACFEEWNVDPLNGPHVELLNLVDVQTVTTKKQAQDMIDRWCLIGPYFKQVNANLLRGFSRRRVATSAAIEKTVTQLDDLLARPTEDWPLYRPAKEAHDDWSAGERAGFAEALATAIDQSARPGLERYRALLRDVLSKMARSADEAGVSNIDPSVYQRLIRVHTSLDLDADTVHATGLAEVARIDAEIVKLGAKLLGAKSVTEVRTKLANDPSMFFDSRDAVAKKAEAALRRAESVVPRYFGRLPKTPCIVKRMEPHEEKFSTIAYYRQPSADGSRPGSYFINTSAPETRPRYEAEALAFHEAVPGHHTQIAIAQEHEGMAEFRKHTGTTAYVEGWALYTERLADEIGLYEGDLDRLGMLSFEAWRACRLVVDTGLHAKNWTRQQAIDFMTAHTLLAANNIANEVDRYIVWPGQALAYKIGQLEILKLRDEAKAKLGARFDLKGFHDVVLDAGAVALPVLRDRVSAWASRR